MVKKIKADKFHVSEICEDARLEAIIIRIKEEFDRLEIPQEIVDFDNDLADLIVKRLMKVPIEQVERFYRDHILVELIKDTIEIEKKYRGEGPFEKRPNCYV